MTRTFKIDGVALPDGAILMEGGNTQLPGGVQGLPAAAWYCESMTAGITVDDPLGEMELTGWHTFTVDESDCTTAPRVFSGWLTGRSISRGPYRDGAARVIECDVIDLNQVFNFEVFRANSAQRPAENDIERAEWALASQVFVGTPLHDNGRFNHTDQPTNFGDSDYVTQYASDLFRSITATSGKNVYAYWSDADSEISIHYDLIANAPTSTLRISNDMADTDSVTLYPFVDAQLNTTPEQVATGLLFGYRGAYVYQRNQDLIDALSPTEFSPDEFYRDTVYRTDRVGKEATANALTASMLQDLAIEKDTIIVTVRVAPDQVGLITAGMGIDVKFTHLNGYEDFVTVPITRHNKVPTEGRTDTWDIHLELAPHPMAAGPGGGGGDNFPPGNPCDGTIVAPVNFSMVNAADAPHEITVGFSPTVGNTVVLDFALRSDGVTVVPTDGTWTNLTGYVDFSGTHQGYRRVRFMKVWTAGDSSPIGLTTGGLGGDNDLMRVGVTELEGALTAFATATTSTDINYCAPPTICGTLTTDMGVDVLLLGSVSVGRSVSDPCSMTPNGGATALGSGVGTGSNRAPLWVGYEITTGDIGLTMSTQLGGCPAQAANGYGGILTAFICPGGDPDAVCIRAGQPSPTNEEVTPASDGTTTTFSTRCPFGDGTLSVKVDAQDQTPVVTSYDGEAGTFTLGFAPEVGEHVTVNYLGR